jgi:L-arabinokinase
MAGMVVLYVSGHGYGHATRAAALVEALRARRPDLPVEARTHAPAWIFTEHSHGARVSRGCPDPGMAQKDALDLDLAASLRVHQELGARWDALVADEAGWLTANRAGLVVGDIPPLAFAAAAAAGLPSIGVSNFSWDWILQEYAPGEPAWAPIVARYAAAYARAELVYRLPMHGDFPSFKKVVDVPLVSRMGTARTNWRRYGKPVVLVAFGGFGIELNFGAGEDLSEFHFCGFGTKPKQLRADWTRLRAETSADQLDAMAGCDIVLCKPGYGMFSEAMAHGKRVVYVPRDGFREIAPLVAGLEARGACAALAREDFLGGRWKEALERARTMAAPAPIPAAGAGVVAGALLERLS